MPIIGGIVMKKILAVLAAACLVFGMVGCQQNNDVSTGQEQTSAVSNNTILPKVKEEETEAETESETTSAPQEAELNIETLAEGEERDYNIEDILKNDLEIDGIPISIPCTLNELLETLGDDYSVDEEEIKGYFDIEYTVKTKYFIGNHLMVSLYYKGDNTYGYMYAIADPQKLDFDTVNVIGYSTGVEIGVLNLTGLTNDDTMDKYFEKYGKPNEAYGGDKYIFLTYEDEVGYFEFDGFKYDGDTELQISEAGFYYDDQY